MDKDPFHITNTHILLPEFSTWVPKPIINAFEMEFGRYPDTLQELAEFQAGRPDVVAAA